jgi:hypothetical protein
MLSRPTTQQIVLDCRAELLSTIDAAVADPAVKIAIQMMENVLRNCAERAAHEIAWMHEEIDAMTAFARRVQASPLVSPAGRAEVDAAMDAFQSGRSDSLHLDDMSANYHLAGVCLSAALEAAMESGEHDLQIAGQEVLQLRLAHEQAIMGEWSFVGRG